MERMIKIIFLKDFNLLKCQIINYLWKWTKKMLQIFMPIKQNELFIKNASIKWMYFII